MSSFAQGALIFLETRGTNIIVSIVAFVFGILDFCRVDNTKCSISIKPGVGVSYALIYAPSLMVVTDFDNNTDSTSCRFHSVCHFRFKHNFKEI